jgi:hypothetical protein
MSTIWFLNQPLSTSVSANNDLFFAVWKLSRAMKKAGWTYKSSSNGTNKDTSGTASNDYWGGNTDPATDSYPGFNNLQAWWNAQGPDTLKIPINDAQIAGADGYFIRGENITQSSSSAQGELVSYFFDTASSTGYLVVMPRVDGSGADPHGWDHAGTITGSISGATVIPSSTVLEYVREVVFWKNSGANVNTNGNIYYQCVDGYNETSSRFSVLATNANCTGSIAPGGSDTVGNLFPTIGSYVVVGAAQQNASGSLTTFPNRFTNHTPASSQNQCHVAAVNPVYSTNMSADGSFWFLIGAPATLGTDNGNYDGIIFSIVDNSEPGDVDPYVWYVPSADAGFIQTVTGNMTTNAIVGSTFAINSQTFTDICFRYWRKRGLSGESFTMAHGTLLTAGQNGASSSLLQLNTTDREQLACTFNTTYLSEDLWVITQFPGIRARKGTLRWSRAVGQGINTAGTDTFGNKSWIALSSENLGGTYGIMIVGPWDGATTPIGTH